MGHYPKQKLPLSKKDKDWREQNVAYHIQQSSFESRNRRDLHLWYTIYAEGPPEHMYNYVKNPYNSTEAKKRNFPARLRTYNIIKPIIDLIMGEKFRRPKNYMVVTKNSDASSKFKEAQKELVIESLKQMYANEMAQQGMDTGVEPQEVNLPKALEDLSANYDDDRAIVGQQMIDLIREYLDLDDEMQYGFMDYLITGESYSYKDVVNDRPYYEVIPASDIDYDKASRHRMVQDGNWAVVYKIMQINEAIDFFRDFEGFDEDFIDELEAENYSGTGLVLGGGMGRIAGQGEEENYVSNRMVEVYHVTWRSLRKKRTLRYEDEMGQYQEMEVNEKYQLDPLMGDIDIQEDWDDEIWEGYRFGNDRYLGIRPRPIQIGKIPYNGLKYNTRYVEPMGICKQGLPYQILYDIVHYRLEVTLAKNKDKIMLMDINAVPDKPGWDVDKFMYYMDAAGIAFIDSAGKEGASLKHFNQYAVLDMALGQYIESAFNILSGIKQEFEDSVGVTRQRKGEVMASDTVGGTERSIFQSAVISEELFRKYEKYEENEYQAFLDMAPHMWTEGIGGMHITGDLRKAFLDIDPSKLVNAELAIFVRNSSKEKEKLDALRSFGQAFAQNIGSSGVTAETIAELLDSDNFANIKRLIAKSEKAFQQMQQQQGEMASQQEQAKVQAEMQEKEAARMHESMENEKDRINKKEIELIKLTGNAQKLDLDRNNVPDSMEIGKSLLAEKAELHKYQGEQQKLALEKTKLAQDYKLKKEDMEVKREKMKSDEKIARTNKNRYD